MEKNVGSVDLQELMQAREELNRERGIETDPNQYKNYNPNRANEPEPVAESVETDSAGESSAQVFGAESEATPAAAQESEKNYDVYDNFSEFEINSAVSSGESVAGAQGESPSTPAEEQAVPEPAEEEEPDTGLDTDTEEKDDEIDLDEFLENINLNDSDIAELEEYEKNNSSDGEESGETSDEDLQGEESAEDLQRDAELNNFIDQTITEINNVKEAPKQMDVPEPPEAILDSDPTDDNYDSVRETLSDLNGQGQTDSQEYVEEESPYITQDAPYISTQRVVDTPKPVAEAPAERQEQPNEQPAEPPTAEQPAEPQQTEEQPNEQPAESKLQPEKSAEESKPDGLDVINLETLLSDEESDAPVSEENSAAGAEPSDEAEPVGEVSKVEVEPAASEPAKAEKRYGFSTLSFKRESIENAKQASGADVMVLRSNSEPIYRAQTQVQIKEQELPEQREDSYNVITEYSFVELSKSSEFERSQKMTYVFGKDEKNRTLYMSVKNMLNTAIFGTNNYYNFAQLASIMLSLAMKNTVDEINFVILDSNISSDFEIFNKSKYMFFNRVAKTNNEIYETLSELVDELNDRYELLVNESVRSIEQYNALKTDPADKLPNILIVYSNYTAYAGQIFAKEIDEKLETLLKLGRIVGINLILSAYQQFDSESINYSLAGRIGFGTKSEELSLYQVGSDNLTKLTRAGEFLYVSFEDDIEIHLKAPNLSVDEAAKILDSLEKN